MRGDVETVGWERTPLRYPRRLALVWLLSWFASGCQTEPNQRLMNIHEAYLEKYRPLWLEAQAA